MDSKYTITENGFFSSSDPYEIREKIDIYLQKGSTLADSEALKAVIDRDILDKAIARTARAYYDCENEAIARTSFNKYELYQNQKNEIGIPTGNVIKKVVTGNAPNIKSVNTFYPQIVDQKIEKIDSIVFSVENPKDTEQKKLLDEFMNYIPRSFDRDMRDMFTDSSNDGFASTIYTFPKEADLKERLTTTFVPGLECIPIYDLETQSELVELIRYYEIQFVDDKGTNTRKRAEVWSKNGVEFWQEDSDHNYLFEDYAAHASYSSTIDDQVKQRQDYDFPIMPVAIYYNNRNGTPDIKKILRLIDEYDFISSLTTNDIAKIREAFLAIGGITGSEDEIRANIMLHGVVASNGPVNLEAVLIPLESEAREKKLDRLEKNIYKFASAVDYYSESFINATSGIALERVTRGLKDKVNALIREIDAFLDQHVQIIVADINRRTGKKYDYEAIKWDVNLVEDVNEKEVIETLAIELTTGMKSLETVIEQNPTIKDVQLELTRLANQPQDNLNADTEDDDTSE